MDHKKCSKCGEVFPNTRDYFHFDNAKFKKGHTIFLVSKCKKCKNELAKDFGKKYRDEKAKEFGSCYQFKKMKDPLFNKKCNEREKRYSVQKSERAKKYRKLKMKSAVNGLELNKKRNKQQVEEMTDYYIARNLARHSFLKPSDFLEYDVLIDTCRQNLKLKRKCQQLKTSTN